MAAFPAALVAAYAIVVWHLGYKHPNVRIRLSGDERELPAVDAARGFRREPVDGGTLLVPDGFKAEGGRLSLKKGRKSASIQVSVQPRVQGRKDGRRLLERVLTARYGYPSLVMRRMLVRNQSDVAYARVALGGLRGFMRRGVQHYRKDGATARVHQFDLFDDERHFRLDFVSFEGAMSDAQVETAAGSFLPFAK